MDTASIECINSHLQAMPSALKEPNQTVSLPVSIAPALSYGYQANNSTYHHLLGAGFALLLIVMCICPFLGGSSYSSPTPIMAENNTVTQKENKNISTSPNQELSKPSLMNPNSYINRAKDAANQVESHQQKVDEAYSTTK